MIPGSEDASFWDVEVRSDQYSIVNKRQKFEAFQRNPTVETLKEAADTWWATLARWSIDHYVEEVILSRGHTAEEIRDMIQEVVDGSRPIAEANIPGMGIATLTEVLEIIDPERFVALNSRSRSGMKALGYDVPEDTLSEEEYLTFVENVKDAVTTYDLRDRLADVDVVGEISDVSDIDVAEAAFNLHVEDEFTFDLNEIQESERKERVVDVEIPRGLYEKVGETVSGNLLFTDEEDYIKTKLREALQEEG